MNCLHFASLNRLFEIGRYLDYSLSDCIYRSMELVVHDRASFFTCRIEAKSSSRSCQCTRQVWSWVCSGLEQSSLQSVQAQDSNATEIEDGWKLSRGYAGVSPFSWRENTFAAIFNTILLLIWTSADPNCNASLPVGATTGRRHVFRGEQIPTGSIPVSIQLWPMISANNSRFFISNPNMPKDISHKRIHYIAKYCKSKQDNNSI